MAVCIWNARSLRRRHIEGADHGRQAPMPVHYFERELLDATPPQKSVGGSWSRLS